MGGSQIDNTDVIRELRTIGHGIKNAKLIESHTNNKIIIEDNRPVRIKTSKWSGR
jgi:hypothetical protein